MKIVIPIFYACDDSFVKYTLVSIQSLIENTSKVYNYEIHVLTSGISNESKKLLRRMGGKNISIRIDNVTDYLRTISEKLPTRDYYSKTTYYRMFIANMYPKYDKAIYIDSDTVVLGDIAQIYLFEMGMNYVAAAREQVMLQVDTFGRYVEKVLNISRTSYFNAGVLLLNCRLFREHAVLDKFNEMLHKYNFIVTQDEDYLNVLCKGRVMWLEQKWNVEVFGRIDTKERDFKVIHYIMSSKPWHYRECAYSHYFWKYAEKTACYNEIRAILENYSDDERKLDSDSEKRLIELAESEIRRINMEKMQGRFKKTKNSTKKSMDVGNAVVEKSKDRLAVLETIAQLEREGRFDIDAEEDPPTKELLPQDIDYLHKKLKSKIMSRITFRIAHHYVHTMMEEKKLIIKGMNGIENIQQLKSGAVLTCNHFNAFDSFAMQLLYEASGQKKRKLYRVIREGNYTNFPGFYGLLMRNCNTFPLSSNVETMKKFMRSMDVVLQKGHFMLVYPEQSMWWNYRKPKPLKKGAFTFAVRNNVPVLPCFITMEDSNIMGDDGFYIQEYTIHVSKAIYPETGKSRAENIEIMRKKNYDEWKNIYEQTYNQPLIYEKGM